MFLLIVIVTSLCARDNDCYSYTFVYDDSILPAHFNEGYYSDWFCHTFLPVIHALLFVLLQYFVVEDENREVTVRLGNVPADSAQWNIKDELWKGECYHFPASPMSFPKNEPGSIITVYTDKNLSLVDSYVSSAIHRKHLWLQLRSFDLHSTVTCSHKMS